MEKERIIGIGDLDLGGSNLGFVIGLMDQICATDYSEVRRFNPEIRTTLLLNPESVWDYTEGTYRLDIPKYGCALVDAILVPCLGDLNGLKAFEIVGFVRSRAYHIISYKHSNSGTLTFFRHGNCGYTTDLRKAGLYLESEVRSRLEHYHNGDNVSILSSRLYEDFTSELRVDYTYPEKLRSLVDLGVLESSDIKRCAKP